MEQANKIQRSEVWEQIYKIVKTIPRADCNGMDAPDAPSVATTLEELFLKLLPIHDVRQRSELLLSAICQFTKRNTQKEIQEVKKWIETDFRK